MKKIWKPLAFIAFLFLGYRSIQMLKWVEAQPEKKNGELGEMEIRVKKLHGLDATIFQPEVYNSAMIKGQFDRHKWRDTLFLKRINKELIEFEIIADSNTTFNSVSLTVWEYNRMREIKPHINKKEDCFHIENNRLLFAFRPWTHTSDLHNLLSANVNYTFNYSTFHNSIPIKVLTDQDYEQYISKRLTSEQKIVWERLKAKYYKRLSTSWKTEKAGNGRRSYFNTLFSAKLFFADKPFKSGKYSNEYVCLDGDFKVTVFVDHTPTFIVEPLNVML